MIGLLALVSLSAWAFGQECDSCDDGACTVIDDVRVGKLCADELCVGGFQPIIGDGDACTSNDGDQNAPIKDCCQTNGDCARFSPGPCHLSTCRTENGASHGWCAHSKIPDCCACDADCPKRKCMVAECEVDESNVVLMKRDVDEGSRMKVLHKRDITGETPGVCVYEEIENCCTTTADCVDGGPPNTQGFCDGGNECQFLPTTQFECLNDGECQNDEMQNIKCRAKGKCVDNVCDHGFCACKSDFDKDSDEDGVCCRDDCDDNDASVTESILCTVEPSGADDDDVDGIDEDGDEFPICGAEVERVCGEVCVNDTVIVQEADVVASHHDYKKLFVKFNCDCCDDNPNDETPDEFIYCGKDANDNGIFAPVEGVFEPPFCAGEVCVLQRKPDPGQTAEESRDVQCQEHFGDEDFNSLTQSQLDNLDEECDVCDEFDGTEGLQKCADTVVFNDRLVGACNITGVPEADIIESCCIELLNKTDTDENVPEEYQQWRACCEELDLGGMTFPETIEEGQCRLSEGKRAPILCDVCECPDPDIIVCPFDNIRCVKDKDYDGFFDCSFAKPNCFSTLPKGFEEAPDPEEDPDKFEEFEEALCQTKHLHSYRRALNGVDEQEVREGRFDGTFCDCNDHDDDVHEEIACYEDKDNDNFPACAGEGEDRKAICMTVCEKECPGGKKSFDEIKKENPAICVKRENDKRSVGALHETLNRHEWFESKKRGVDDSRRRRRGGDDNDDDDKKKGKGRDDDDDDDDKKKKRRPRRDEKCKDVDCQCDCCDQDNMVFPGSPFACNSKTLCDDNDFNCDNVEVGFAVCPEANGFENHERICWNLPAAQENADSLEGDGPFVGHCEDPVNGECEAVEGWLIEGTSDEERKRKRQVSVTLMEGCLQVVKFLLEDDEVVAMPVDGGETRPLQPGDCGEWVEQCHFVDFNGEQSGGEQCSPDCEICTHVLQ